MLRSVSLISLLLLSLGATQAPASSRLRVEDQTITANESDVQVQVTVRRSDDEGAVSVDYSTVPVSATEGVDYVATSGTLSWPDGDDEDRVLTVTLLDDTEDESTESFEIVLSNPVGGATIEAGRGQAVVFLADDDSAVATPEKPGVLKFSERRVTTSESAGFVTLQVERSKGQDGPVSVQYVTADGTATAPNDFQATSGSLSWGDGDATVRVVTIALVDDGPGESLESFEVKLVNPTGGAALDSLRRTALVTLVGDAPGGPGAGAAGRVRFDMSAFHASESAAAAIITVDRHDGSSGPVAVTYSVVGGTATEGEDFQVVAGSLSWSDGDSSTRSFMVPLVDDTVEEGSETVRLMLSDPVGGAELDAGRATAILTILDDDGGRREHPGGRLRFVRDAFSAVEGAGGARIVVQRHAGDLGAVTARVRTLEGSATPGEDFEPLDAFVTWADGESGKKTVDVVLLDDLEVEPNETVALALAADSAEVQVEPERAAARLEILDDDLPAANRCEISPFTLCLQQGRFEIEVVWRAGDGSSGRGETRALSADSGIVWFFDEENVEMLIKALDACEPFDSYWIFFAATTDLDFTVFVTDTRTGLQKEYSNLLGEPARPVQDTETFRGCPRDDGP